MKNKDEKALLKKKRIIGLCSVVIVAAVMSIVAYFAVYKFFSFSDGGVSFKAFIEGYGWAGRFVALAIQILQVFIAIIPGEFVEVGMGLSFGAIEGTVICLAGVGLGSALIFLLIKKWGIRLVELFIDRNKIDSLKFINSEKKLGTLVFILFLIPGTPKDLLTYIVPLTRMKLSEFLFITLIARIPSIVSSTIGGNFFGEGKYFEGILLFVITGAVSVAGVILYNIILKKYHARKEKRQNH